MYRVAEELIKVADLLLAFEHPNKEELETYLKLHPKADPKKHWVKEQKEKFKEREENLGPEKLNELHQKFLYEKRKKEVEGNPVWKKNEKKLIKIISGTAEKYEQARGAHVNKAYFETHADGTQSVWKPDKGSRDIEGLRPELRGDVTQSQREAVAYQLDTVLGLGVVPPTVYVTKKFKDEESGKDKFFTGSSQLFVKGKSVYKMGDNMDTIYRSGSSELQLQIQKIALFDSIVGNTDRHTGNIFIDSENDKAYAIDNGLTLPKREKFYFVSEPRDVVTSNAKNKKKPYDKRLIEHLAATDKDSFMKVMKDSNLENEGELAWKRVEKILHDYGMKHKGPSEWNPSEPAKAEPVPKKEEIKQEPKEEKPKEEIKQEPVKEEIKPKPEVLQSLKKSLGERGEKLNDAQLLILFKTLAKRGWFSSKGKSEKTMEAIGELAGKV